MKAGGEGWSVPLLEVLLLRQALAALLLLLSNTVLFEPFEPSSALLFHIERLTPPVGEQSCHPEAQSISRLDLSPCPLRNHSVPSQHKRIEAALKAARLVLQAIYSACAAAASPYPSHVHLLRVRADLSPPLRSP